MISPFMMLPFIEKIILAPNCKLRLLLEGRQARVTEIGRITAPAPSETLFRDRLGLADSLYTGNKGNSY